MLKSKPGYKTIYALPWQNVSVKDDITHIRDFIPNSHEMVCATVSPLIPSRPEDGWTWNAFLWSDENRPYCLKQEWGVSGTLEEAMHNCDLKLLEFGYKLTAEKNKVLL